jgi:hypothetical protein
MENKNNPTTLLSTSEVARKNNISRDSLFDYLLSNSYLNKKNGRHVLTDKGLQIGGSYVECAKGTWPVWSDNNIDAIIKSIEWPVGIIGNFSTMQMKASERLRSSNVDKNILHRQLMHGTKILVSQEELDAYICMLGAMHEGKLIRAYEELHDCENLIRLTSGKNIQIIDYACGQGLASMLLIEFLKNKRVDYHISKAILVEPSKLALEGCASRFTGNTVKINKKFDDLLKQDILTTESCTKFHLFSNILDMGNEHFVPKMLADKIINSQKGTNYFVCVSALEKGKLNDFMHYFDQHSLISSVVGQIENPSSFPGAKPWQVVWNIFKVEL